MAVESKVTRRKALGVLGATGLVAGSGALAAHELGSSPSTAVASNLSDSVAHVDPSLEAAELEKLRGSNLAEELLSPLKPGDRVGRWSLVSVQPSSRGSLMLELETSDQDSFRLEVLAREDAGPQAPGESRFFSVFVRNAGQGHVRTSEEHGLAAMTLASLISTNETEDRARLLTSLTRRVEHEEGPAVPV
ncbi:MAG: hypothetical protein U0271_19205 [Polyangiaceae bacterium]